MAAEIYTQFDRAYADLCRTHRHRANKELQGAINQRLCTVFPLQSVLGINFEDLPLGSDKDACEALFSALATRAKDIGVVWLRACQLNEEAHWSMMSAVLSDHLAILNLSNCALGATGMAALRAGLVRCASLVHLFLHDTGLRSTGTRYLCEALVNCGFLQSLDVSSCHIGTEGGSALLGLIETHPRLRTLCIQRNLIAQAVADQIDERIRVRYGEFLLSESARQHSEPVDGVVLGTWRHERVGFAGMMGRRPSNEDAMLMHEHFHVAGWSLYGLFDGHGTRDVAQGCAEHASHSLAEAFCSLLAVTKLGAVRSMTVQLEPLDAGLRRSGADVRVTVDEVESCLRSCFAYLAQHVGSTSRSFGSTALLVLVTPEYVFSANAGDTRCVLASWSGAMRLSVDHKPTTVTESARIRILSGVIENNRVNGVLAVSRAIGDTALAPFVTSDPDIKAHRMQPGDVSVILACDGVWDVLADETASQIVCSSPSPQCAANMLRNLAFALGSSDNISALVVQLQPSKRVQASHSGHRRSRSSVKLPDVVGAGPPGAAAERQTGEASLRPPTAHHEQATGKSGSGRRSRAPSNAPPMACSGEEGVGLGGGASAGAAGAAPSAAGAAPSAAGAAPGAASAAAAATAPAPGSDSKRSTKLGVPGKKDNHSTWSVGDRRLAKVAVILQESSAARKPPVATAAAAAAAAGAGTAAGAGHGCDTGAAAGAAAAAPGTADSMSDAASTSEEEFMLSSSRNPLSLESQLASARAKNAAMAVSWQCDVSPPSSLVSSSSSSSSRSSSPSETLSPEDG